jgi:hypothetical protein
VPTDRGRRPAVGGVLFEEIISLALLKLTLISLALFFSNLVIWPTFEFTLVIWPFRQFYHLTVLSETQNDFFALEA